MGGTQPFYLGEITLWVKLSFNSGGLRAKPAMTVNVFAQWYSCLYFSGFCADNKIVKKIFRILKIFFTILKFF